MPSGIYIRTKSALNKVKPAWNRGLTKETDERLAMVSKMSLGRKLSPETIKKMYESYPKRNKKISNTVKKLWENPEYRKKQEKGRKKAFIKKSIYMKKKWKDPEYREKLIKARLLIWQNPKFRKKMTIIRKEIWQDPIYRNKILSTFIISNRNKTWGKKISKALKRKWQEKKYRQKQINIMQNARLKPENKKKHREGCKKAGIKRWQNPEYRNKQVKMIVRGVIKRPNKIENFLNTFLQKILPNEYKYVGNGKFILGGKCPDFMNINGQKKLIEVYGDYWHRNDNPQNRINYFKKFGFDCLVLWESEIRNNINIEKRIRNFNDSN